MGDLVRIWSYEHDAWWAPDSRGYTSVEADAGLYPREEAVEICRKANYGGGLEEEIVELVQPLLKDRVASLIREINAQNNRATASPYYFAVQSKVWVDCANDGDKEVVAYDGKLWTLQEWLDSDEEATQSSWEDQGPFDVRAIWEDKAIFLTEKEALKFIRANGHHLNEPRTYVKHFWRNSEMEMVMRALEEFSGEKLAWR